MADFKTVAKVGDIPEGQGIAYAVNSRMVAVFNRDESYEAIDDFCPHMGASLAGGHVEDGVVTCPWHAWRFKTCDGTWCDNPSISIDSFEVRVEGDEIQVCVPDKDPPGASEIPNNPEDTVDDAPSTA
jgi:nitrite reductase (NADH) small subunit/3-phenylpropionate/trans-cinnamate dioxygenase ferredoxin subunit